MVSVNFKLFTVITYEGRFNKGWKNRSKRQSILMAKSTKEERVRIIKI